MAKQAGDIFIEGTIDDLTFYKMEGKYYVRTKSSLTGKKFWKHKAFERSRQSCKRFSEGNKLASRLYRLIEKEKKQYKLFCFLKKRAILLIKEGKSVVDAEQILVEYLMEFGFIEKIMYEPTTKAEKEGFNKQVLTDENCQTQDSQVRKTGFAKTKIRVYVCAAGPPSGMRRCKYDS